MVAMVAISKGNRVDRPGPTPECVVVVVRSVKLNKWPCEASRGRIRAEGVPITAER